MLTTVFVTIMLVCFVTVMVTCCGHVVAWTEVTVTVETVGLA